VRAPSAARRIASAFGAAQVRSSPDAPGNTVVVALKADAFPDRDTLVARRANHRNCFVARRQVVRMMRAPARPRQTRPTPMKATDLPPSTTPTGRLDWRTSWRLREDDC
jgi:hypothetical protein